MQLTNVRSIRIDQSVTVGVPWKDARHAEPLTNLATVISVGSQRYGFRFSRLVLSPDGLDLLTASKQFVQQSGRRWVEGESLSFGSEDVLRVFREAIGGHFPAALPCPNGPPRVPRERAQAKDVKWRSRLPWWVPPEMSAARC